MRSTSCAAPRWRPSGSDRLGWPTDTSERTSGRSSSRTTTSRPSADADALWEASDLDLSSLDRKVDAVAREVKTVDLDPVPHRGGGGGDVQDPAATVRLQPQDRGDAREHRGRRPQLWRARVPVPLG